MSIDYYKLLPELELNAHELGKQLDELFRSLSTVLNQMLTLTLDCTKVFSVSVDCTCETVNSSIKSTYSLMAKCEELSNSMCQLEPLYKGIDNLKRTLDKFEDALFTAPKV